MELTGNVYPFREEKVREFDSARTAVERLEPLFEQTLEGRLRLAVAGNRLDFFRDLADVEREWRSSLPPPVLDDSRMLKPIIAESPKFLVCGDNPGELTFDIPLLKK